MNRVVLFGVLGLGIFALGLGMGLGVNQRRASKKAEVAQTQADQAVGQAQTHAAQAAAADRQAGLDRETVSNADARAAVARRELNRLSAALPKKAPAPIEPVTPTPESNALEITRAALEQANEVIADQQTQVEARDKLIASLTNARDEYKARAEADERALALQKIAADATVHAEHASGIRQQFIRFGEGIVAGYIGGRLQR